MILAIQNTGIERLGSEAGGASMKAAAEVYAALGVPDRIGFSQEVAAGHCQFPGSQTADVLGYADARVDAGPRRSPRVVG